MSADFSPHFYRRGHVYQAMKKLVLRFRYIFYIHIRYSLVGQNNHCKILQRRYWISIEYLEACYYIIYATCFLKSRH